MQDRSDAGLLILEVFRLNARLLAGGDDLVAPLGLSSARWQVLGVIAGSTEDKPVAHIARAMGLQRQGVQRIVNELSEDGFVVFRENPHHRRAQLVILTDKGRTAYSAAMRRREPWVEKMVSGISKEDISLALMVLSTIRKRIDEAG